MWFYLYISCWDVLTFWNLWLMLPMKNERFMTIISFIYLKIYLFIYLFLERGKGGRKRGKHQCMVASCATPAGDLVHNPGMCPDWESNQQPLGSHASTKSTEPHQPGLTIIS